ncbi:ribosomal protein S6 kinase-like 1 [Trichomycterus rosablanca]|uniref:ribosomal protein S6 kinase-like 1 n=1 Tax=Trichomycterus rosablanca TaxID=2290929 RepID=UPI002F359AFE
MDKGDYLVDAAKQIRMALDREVNEDYEAAFSYYKNGVDLLLNGVQVDPNKERREAVKRKTTQYLKRAEEIFNSHLQNNFSKNNMEPGGYSSLRFRSIRHLSSPVEDLEMCKVVGIIDKVLTVQNLISKETFVIKSLPKSSWENRGRPTIIPQGVPFMVKLLRYYVSEDSVFLHLEHVQGGKLFSKLHRIRSDPAREYPECFSPNQHKIQLKNSYTSPILHQLNGGSTHRPSAVPKQEILESPDPDLLTWNETQHQLESCGTHSYCEETGCLQNSRSDKDQVWQKPSSNPCAIRTDSVSCLNGQHDRFISQDSFPLPVHPCVIVDTRDPLSVTNDLLGNDVHIERIDSSLDFDKAWTAHKPAQEHVHLPDTGSNSDILGINNAAQITLSSLFGDATQPTLCSTVNVLPQKVRIVPNASCLPSQGQKQEGNTHSTHGRTNHCSETLVHTERCHLVANLSSGNPQPGTLKPLVQHKPQRPAHFLFDFTSNTNEDGVNRDLVEDGTNNWEHFSPTYKDEASDAFFTHSSLSTINPSHWHNNSKEPEEEPLIEVDGWCHLPKIRTKSYSVKQQRSRWGLPEAEVQMWGAQILLALESLHEQGIVCRDLNPRNILLNSSGKVCLTYFGQWTEVQSEINPTAMEQMYCAPEIGGVSKITESCDWWSLGALLFELLTGMPLWQCHPTGVHPHTQLLIPDHLSTAAASLLTELLQYDAGYRLGSGGGGVSDIKCHPFFNSVPWHQLSS